MNRYPIWKYLVIVVVLVVATLYTIPNFFPEVPAVQVSTNKSNIRIDDSTVKTIDSALKADNVPHKDITLDPTGVKVRFDDADAQLKGKESITRRLNPDPKTASYIVALNLISSSPAWLSSIGALPMYLGLDLRGGVYFMLQVDMKAALDKAADRYITDLRTLLRDKNIRYAGVGREGQDVVLRFRDEAERRKAEGEIVTSAFNTDLVLRSVDAGPSDLRLVASVKQEAQRRIQTGAVLQNITILRNRVNELGVAEPIIQQQGIDRVVVQLPGVQDTARAKDILGRTATLEIRMVNEDPGALEQAMSGNVPFGSDLYTERNGKPELVRRQVVLTGDRITDAQSSFDSRTNEPIVSVSVDGQGARVLRDITRENIGKGMAILLTEKGRTELLLAPKIRDELSNRFQITGRFTTRETNDIALLMRAGALAAPMEIIEERTVGPSLGKDNIQKGFNSTLYGFIALALFICVYYQLMGVVSAIALAINLMLLVALLSMLQATLTLPGMAAIALTLGMAIDANVLINERIREELRKGSKPQEAISEGYARAFGTILDSNVTTLIAGIALLLFGSGPIRGFAVVHCLGIITSMFSAVFVSRGIVNLIYGGKKRLEKISIGQIWRPPAAADNTQVAKS
jgi:preprotein translocase subunit SecD